MMDNYNDETIIAVAKAYNRVVRKLKLNNLDINLNSDLEDIKDELSSRISNLEKDGINSRFVNIEYNRIIAFSKTPNPEGPDTQWGWLSNNNLKKIKLYQEIIPEFIFLGAVISDCSKLSFCNIGNIDFEIFDKYGLTKIGLIYNLSAHGEEGSHWVGVFFDLYEGIVYFFDPTGKEQPSKEPTSGNPSEAPTSGENMGHFIRQFIDYYEDKTGKEAKLFVNKKHIQNDQSECGVYSTNFILRIASGEAFESIIENSLDKHQINTCRRSYFNNYGYLDKPNLLCDPFKIY